MAKTKTGRKKEKLQAEFDNMKKALFVLRALNHSTRQQILNLIHLEKEISVNEIYSRLKLEQSQTSTYLALLRKAGAVHTRREGQNIFYSINYQRLGVIEKGSRIILGFDK